VVYIYTYMLVIVSVGNGKKEEEEAGQPTGQAGPEKPEHDSCASSPLQSNHPARSDSAQSRVPAGYSRIPPTKSIAISNYLTSSPSQKKN
jgi:hypothetical protein